jgi:hypothetical protein
MSTNAPDPPAKSNRNTLSELRAFVLVMGVLNVICGVLVVTALSFCAGLGMLGVVDRYVYLDKNDVIDRTQLGELLGAAHVDDWNVTKDWLFGGYFRGVNESHMLVAAVFIAAGVANLVAWLLTRPKNALAEQPRSVAKPAE